MNEIPETDLPEPPGVCPYCGHHGLDFQAGDGDFSAFAASKRVVCLACGRSHRMQYQAVGMRLYGPDGDLPTSHDVRFAAGPACSASCRFYSLFTKNAARLPGRMYVLIAVHVGLFFLLPWIEDTWNTSQIFGLSWFAIMHIQFGLLGVWLGVGGASIPFRGLITLILATSVLFLLSVLADGDFDDFVPWLLPEVFAAAGLFALAERGGYRFWMVDPNSRVPREGKLQFSILHLLAAMTLLSLLAGGVSVVFWLVNRTSNEEFLLSVAFAILNSLAILSVCWAVLAPGHVLLRSLMALALTQIMALTLVYGADEWDLEVVIVVCSTACIVFSALAATFAILRTAGYRYGRYPISVEENAVA